MEKVGHIIIFAITKMHVSNYPVLSAMLNFGSYLQVSKVFTVGQLQPKMYFTDPGTLMIGRLYIHWVNKCFSDSFLGSALSHC